MTLANIPYGKVSSYGSIARRAGYPGLARHVAYLLKHLPEDSQIPWHRVVNSRGKISLPPDSNMFHAQVNLLKDEGLNLTAENTIPASYFWQ